MDNKGNTPSGAVYKIDQRVKGHPETEWKHTPLWHRVRPLRTSYTAVLPSRRLVNIEVIHSIHNG